MPLALPDGKRQLPGTAVWHEVAVIVEALEAAASSSSTWLRADLAREIAARLPSEVAGSAAALVQVVDRLTEQAAGRCVELHPPAAQGVARRHDGRPISEHVVDALDQEARLLSWAGDNVGSRPALMPAGEAQAMAARDVAGDPRLVLVVGPAGTGKTTLLASAVEMLRQQGRSAVGLAPSGKAADVLARETATPATTLAKLLNEHSRPSGPQPEWRLPADTTLILDSCRHRGYAE